MSNLTKQNQNYFLITRLMLQFWFERMHEQEIGALIQQTKTLPSGKIEKELSIEFSKWDTPKKEASIILEEYIWGVRCGVMQFVNIDSCSFASVLAVAKTDQMCEIYSPAKVQYYSDGSRRVVPHNVSVYNTDAKFSCYSLIDIKQAENLFPQYLDIFENCRRKPSSYALPMPIKFVSPIRKKEKSVSVSMLLIRILSLLLFIWEICGRHFNMSRVKSKPGAAWLFVTLNISTNLNI